FLAGMTAASLMIVSTIAGARARDSGDNFWDGFANHIRDNWAMTLAISGVMIIGMLGIGLAIGGVAKAAGKIKSKIVNLKTSKPLCFAEGTLVLCKNENGEECHKKIEDIEVGDLVWAFNEETGESDWKPVKQLFRNGKQFSGKSNEDIGEGMKDWTGITINGKEIISTPGHKYYLPFNNENRNPNEIHEHAGYEVLSEKWVSAQDLKVGDKLLLSCGNYGIVEKVRAIHYEKPQTTYNFEVADFHTYFVGEQSVCVHNNGPCQTPTSQLKHTNGKILYNSDFRKLKSEIMSDGIRETVKITEVNGSKYIVDGNHRVAIAKKLGMKTVPTEMVNLPYKGFTTPSSVIDGHIEYLMWLELGGKW
ncbi:MAG: polymorphic toxin-type HINT domain-containing protein, partial [Firmicutes bacterium]|nr:polymorphic toxin-type HINT domain-containing protein [Bacillota bacterium]